MNDRVQVATAPTEQGAQAAARHFASQGAQNVRIAAMQDGSFVVTADKPGSVVPHEVGVDPAAKERFEIDWKRWEQERNDRREAAHMTGSSDHRSSSMMGNE